MKRKLAVLGPAYLLGLFLASFLASWLSCLAGGLFLCIGAAVMIFVRPGHDRRMFSSAAAAFSLASGLFLYSGYDMLIYRPVISDSGDIFSGEAYVRDVKVYSEYSSFCTLECRLPCGRKALVGWYAPDSDIVRGDRLVISGELYIPKNTDFFSSKDYYASENVFLLIKSAEVSEHIKNENSIFRCISRFRSSVCEDIRHYIPSDTGELIIGMLFGKDSWRMSDETEKRLYRSGIGHIASVSGMHIGLAAGLAAAAASALRLSKNKRFVMVVLAAFLYAMIADFTVSAVRALIMIVFVYAADLFRRQNDPLSSLCAAAFIITVGSPFIIRSASFLMSFSGVFGAAVLAPAFLDMIRDAYERKYDRDMAPNFLLASAVTSVCASLAVIPVSAMFFDELSVISPVVNLVLSPLYSSAVMIALAGAFFTLSGMAWLSGGLFIASAILCRPVIAAAELVGSLPAVTIPAGLDIIFPLIAFVILTAFSAFMLFSKPKAAAAVSAAVLISSVCISVYRLTPPEDTGISLLTEGNGCVLLISDNGTVSVFDFMGATRGINAAESKVTREDLGKAGLVCLTEKCSFSYPLYKSAFPEAQIISSVGGIGLTYSDEENIIVFGGVVCRPYDGYAIIETDGIRILCINRKCVPPSEHFDLCIYNCRADVSADADRYAVTQKRFSGAVPADSEVSFCSSVDYLASDGKLRERNERKWLR